MPGISDNIIFDFKLWKAVLAAVLVILPIVAYRRTHPPLPVSKRGLLAFMRICGFAVIIIFIMNPAMISITKNIRPPLVAVLFDVSKSMSVRDCGGESRVDRAAGLLGSFTKAIRGASSAEVITVPFSSGLHERVSADSLFEASGEGTDISGAVNAAVKRYGTRNLSALVLFTDGRITRGMQEISGVIPVPVFAVCFGDTTELADVSIAEVNYERVQFKGTESVLEAVVSSTGTSGGPLDVQLLEDGELLDSAVIGNDTGEGEYSTRLRYTPEEEGDHRLLVKVVPPSDGDRTENNEEMIRIRVLKDKIKVLFLDRYADWNTTFLRDLARRSKRIEIMIVTWTPRDGYHLLPDRRSWEFPDDPSGFDDFDLLAIADAGSIFTNRANVAVVEEYVASGGGFLILADENSPLTDHMSLALLEELLPVREVAAPEIVSGEYAIFAEPDGADGTATTLMPDGVGGGSLPPLAAVISGLGVRAGASVPIRIGDDGGGGPFLAVQRYQEGISAVVLGFPIWRWKLTGGVGGAYDSFLGGLIQYLSGGTEFRGLELNSDRIVYRSGDPVTLYAYLKEAGRAEAVRGEIRRIEGQAERLDGSFPFDPVARQPGSFKAKLGSLEPGDYRITARELRSTGPGSSADLSISVQPVSVEFMSTACDFDFVRRIAGSSGGAAVRPHRISSLVRRMELSEDVVLERKVDPLCDVPWLFVLFLVCFSAEWALRKAWGLI